MIGQVHTITCVMELVFIILQQDCYGKCGVQENDLTIAGAWNHLLGITMNKNFER